jgi:hypothetical protein
LPAAVDEALDEVITPATQQMLERWEDTARKGDPLDVDGEMMRLALEVVGKRSSAST